MSSVQLNASIVVPEADVIISKAKILLPPPPQSAAAMYMIIENHQADPITTFSAKSAIAEKISLHEMTMEKGVMKMREAKGLTLKAHSSLTLEQGGAHWMLESLNEPLYEGQKVPVTLCFNGSCQSMTVEVVHPMKEQQQSQGHGHNHHHHHHH
ncbi:MAG: copper chaperone PCu(A)C [Cellvibrionales bacterium]|nr:copper chaperone PCu(A)C [Cellvibrionales bacterium]